MSLSPLHYLNASAPHGCFHPTGDHPSNPAQVDALIQYLQEQKVKKLTIHFHGGLVSEHRGIEIAQNMVTNYKDVSHPLSIVWDSGFLKTIQDRFDLIEKTELFKQLRDIVLKKVYQKLGIEDGAKGPVPLDDYKIQTEIQSEQPFAQDDQPAREKAQRWNAAKINANELAIEAELEMEIDTDHALVVAVKSEGPEDEYYRKDHLIPENLSEEGTKGFLPLAIIKPLASVIIRVIKRFWKNTDHDLYPTSVEEILREFYIAEFGAQLWDGMKEKTDLMWADNTGLSGTDQHAGRYLLEALSKHKAQDNEFILDVVGHSAGSIAICNMLRCIAANYPNLLPLRNIIFLAPACRSDLFVQEVLPEPHRFTQFRMFTMDDTHERKDNCAYVYTHSLLYLISGILEKLPDEHILGLMKHFSDEEPYIKAPELVKIKEFLMKENRLVLSVSASGAAAGMESHAKAHGKFDNDEATIRSLVSIISQ